MRNIELLLQGKKLLQNSDIPNASLDSELILSDILKISREKLLINLDAETINYNKKKYFQKIKERMKKTPIAYILNKKEFWSTEFFINNKVLIPRPDTELIVENSLDILPIHSSKKILDIGSGSGCIIISILKERKLCRGTCIDISKNTINVAKFNAKIQHIENRIRFINSSIDNFFGSKYDLIVSNPPYIKKFSIKSLDDDIRFYEPKIALDGGIDGLSTIYKVIKKSSKLLKKNGRLIIEIDNNQVHRVKKMLLNEKFYVNKLSKDFSGKIRNIVSTKI